MVKSDNKQEDIEVEEIKDLSNEEQANKIAQKFASISQEYEPLDVDKLNLPSFCEEDIPVITEAEVLETLESMNMNKAGRKEDIPARIYKHFATIFCAPITHMINCAIREGKWPSFLKSEKVTPIPKISRPQYIKDLRPISGLFNMSKILEKITCKLVLADMKKHIDPSQFAGQKKLSTEHYLVKMLDAIMRAIDNNDSKAVIALFVD